MVTRRPGVATRTRGNMKRSSPKARAYSVIVDPRAQTYRPHPQGATTKNPPLVGKRHPCNQQRPPTENNNIKTFKMSSFSSGHRHSSLLPSSSTSKKLRKRSVMNSKQPLLPSTLPSYTIPPEDKDDDQHPLRTSKVRRMSWGMFQVAYEAPVRHFSLDAFRQTVRELRRSMPCATHLLLEIYRTARTPVAVHVLAASLLVVAPAFSLYLSAAVLGVVEQSVVSRRVNDADVNMLQVLVIIWLFVAVMSTLATRIMADTAFTLKGYLRAHFLPQLVRASLRLDLSALTSRKALRSLPQEYGFEMEVPGFRFFHEIITRLRNLLTVLSEVGVLVMIICRRGVHETQLLVFFVFLLPVVMLLKPNGGFGGAGFVFWTPNRNFYYLAALYKMAFSRDFRPTLARDGLCAYIAEEYQRISAELGYQNVETLGLQPAVPVHWYWDLIYHLMVDYPLAVCALMLPWAEPLSSLVSMVLVQHATTTLKQSIEQLRWAQSPDTLVEVLESAEQLYEAIAFDSELNRGTIAYPDQRSTEKGMKIVFRNVSFKHDQEDDFAIPGEHLTISDVDVEIPAGSLAVVVGGDHSGKTSLLSLIPRVHEPSAGQILIDDEPLEAYDVDSVRGAMACISQREEMYPLTLRHNLLMGAGRDAKRDEEVLATAARLGCSADFIDALPAKFDTVLDPAPVTAQSIQGCGNAYITPAAMNELETHGPNFMPTFLAEGDRQRLAATRMFARLLQQKDRIRLIVCDEATREMDPRDEREFLRNVKELGAGKTIIFVTHRFGDLVKEADVILVMKDGKVVQQGTHTELMQEGERNGGCREYAEMYHAQAAGFV